jgi:hypothetical protein
MVLLWLAITLIFNMKILIEFVKINQVAFEEAWSYKGNFKYSFYTNWTVFYNKKWAKEMN